MNFCFFFVCFLLFFTSLYYYYYYFIHLLCHKQAIAAKSDDLLRDIQDFDDSSVNDLEKIKNKEKLRIKEERDSQLKEASVAAREILMQEAEETLRVFLESQRLLEDDAGKFIDITFSLS